MLSPPNVMSNKRTLDSFFGPAPGKKQRVSPHDDEHADPGSAQTSFSRHSTYPHPIADLPASVHDELASLPGRPGRAIDDQADLDLLYFEPYIPAGLAPTLFRHLRASLPFYRVEYTIQRYGVETHIRTPRYTTVFGLDATARFGGDDDGTVVDAATRQPVPAAAYARCAPRPLPACLDALRRSAEAACGCAFNFCLVNYYASGADSISYHSDDERFLGPEPAIASFSLGARRDFFMKHKPPPAAKKGKGKGKGREAEAEAEAELEMETVTAKALLACKQVKLPLGSGDMVLMRGKTQANWLHSVPKRTGRNEKDGGRINITFRKAMVKGGTDNYYNYNVGRGPVYRWNDLAKEMTLWKKT
ncbi:hypothetical protein P8C59_003618 [Phyllachora maydis]|uniref:Fe2OG dioxygenase domain-containing protein n=1 Tax=Phyllachora maydis TaxID=1825666 RepID=A0AAD9I0K6_9PEZI|nr:hypothetical protein P8C59_003618 [Phyllachora maydis]